VTAFLSAVAETVLTAVLAARVATEFTAGRVSARRRLALAGAAAAAGAALAGSAGGASATASVAAIFCPGVGLGAAVLSGTVSVASVVSIFGPVLFMDRCPFSV
jgi:hypothetical protein